MVNNQSLTSQKLMNEQFESKLDTLQQSNHELFYSQPHSSPTRNFVRSSFENPTSLSMKASSPQPCNYHHRFGSAARNCAGPPCPFFTRPSPVGAASHLHGFSAPLELTAEHLCFIHDKWNSIFSGHRCFTQH